MASFWNGEGGAVNISRKFLVAVPYSWLLVLFLVPFLIVLKISLSDVALSIPPYTPTLDFSVPDKTTFIV